MYIKEYHRISIRFGREIDTFTNQLGVKTIPTQLKRIREWCATAAEEVANATKARQIKKFNNLQKRRFGQ